MQARLLKNRRSQSIFICETCKETSGNVRGSYIKIADFRKEIIVGYYDAGITEMAQSTSMLFNLYSQCKGWRAEKWKYVSITAF